VSPAGRVALGLSAALLLAAAIAVPGTAMAFPESSPELPARWCEFTLGQTGTDAGQCIFPRGIAADPRNGHVFVADQNNRRIDEFNALGQFVRAWGWGVDTGAAELQSCTAASTCESGLIGSGVGQFGAGGPQGVALDSAGNVYVVDFSNRRVQKFDSKGNFVLMIGGKVNETSGGNVCPRAGFPADFCKAAPAASGGGGQGEFGSWEDPGDFITVDENGTATDTDDIVYVGDVGRIQKFDAVGVYQGEIAVTGTVLSLDVDDDGNLYRGSGGGVRKISPSGEDITPAEGFELPFPPATAVTVDAAGHVYAFGRTCSVCSGSTISTDPIIEFDPSGKIVDEFGINEFSASTGIEANLCPGSEAPGNLYVSNSVNGPGPPPSQDAFIRAYGTEPIGCFKARTGPAKDVAETSATLTGTVIPSGLEVSECFFEWGTTTAYGQVAECDPKANEIGSGSEPVLVEAQLSGLTKGTVHHFRLLAKVGTEVETGVDEEFKTFGPPVIGDERTVSVAQTEATLKALVNPEGFASTYSFQYTTQANFEAEGFENAQSTPAIEVGKDGERSEHPVVANLTGLIPGTAYRWRVVAANLSGSTEGTPRAFATYLAAGPPPTCPNEAFRVGPSAKLPDCRAYEMVSPVDKGGGDIVSAKSTTGDPGGYMQASPDGNSIAYTALFASFAGQETSGKFNQYLAARGSGGWASQGIHPPVTGHNCCTSIMGFNREFLGFSTDLCNAWVIDYQEPALMPDGQDGIPNLYRRDTCDPGAGGLETLADTPLLPQGTLPDYVNANSLQGLSEDGSHALFASDAPLQLQDCRTSTTAKTISYQWLRDGVPIEGATSPFYEPGTADAGTALQCQVFAINDNAGSTQVSNPAAVIPPEPGDEISPPTAPASIAAPAQSATLTVGGPGGQTLTCNEGSWGGSPAFSYRWYRNGAAIEGATASTYVVSATDLVAPAVFQCAVRGTNADGAVTKVSNNRPTSPVPSPTAPAANASNGGEMPRVYDRFGGEPQLVSVLPGGVPADAGAGVGSTLNLDGAVSEDGARVYLTSAGKIYLRLHPEQGIVADECSDNATVACTLEVSKGGALFWAGAADGSKALYSEEEALRVFDLQKAEEGKPLGQNRQLVEDEVIGVAGASEDLSRIYFVSRAALAGGAVAGEPNLYLDQEGTKSFVAALTEGDVGKEEPGGIVIPYDLDSVEPYQRATRVTPDGARIVFNSRAQLTEYDSTDAESGRPSVEVYSYEAGGELVCVSCNPSGARPSGGQEMRRPYESPFEGGILATNVTAAAWIPTWEHRLHASNVLSEDGGRIFFNANDALLPGDANGAPDVYEWEAPGVGGCEEEEANFFAQNGGCLYLISSGQSSYESEFWAASPDGDDVFFTTASSLVPPDPGSIDLYDARVGGGLEYPEPKPQCEGEACQSPPAPPDDPTPASSAFDGAGNVVEPPAKCPKGKVRRKGRCVKPPCPKGKRKVKRRGKVRCVPRKRNQRGNANRRAGR
jgi:hypothetical protein